MSSKEILVPDKNSLGGKKFSRLFFIKATCLKWGENKATRKFYIILSVQNKAFPYKLFHFSPPQSSSLVKPLSYPRMDRFWFLCPISGDLQQGL